MKQNIKTKAKLTVACFTMLMATSTMASDYDTHWAKSAIDTWSNYQIVKGQAEGVFAPNSPVTRAELATFLNRLFTIEAAEVSREYTDIAPEAWYTPAITAVTSHGFMYIPEDTFAPNQHATRQEVAYAIAKAYNIHQDTPTIAPFKDDTSINAWAKSSVYALAQQGYITGTPDGNFNPQAPITRAEIVTMIDNITANYIYEPGTYTEVQPGNLIINASDVTLSNVTVDGNLYITDKAKGSTVTLDNVKVTGTVYIEAGNVTLSGTYNQVEVRSQEAFTLAKGRIKELMLLGNGASITLGEGTLTEHLIIAADVKTEIKGMVTKTTSNQKAPMNIIEAGVVIADEVVPVSIDGTTITINLPDLLERTTISDVMEGLIIYTDVEGAYLKGYSGGQMKTNIQYSFKQADYQLGMIAEMLDQVAASSDTLKEAIELVGVSPDTIFFMLSNNGEISIRHMMSQFNEINAMAKSYFGQGLPMEYEFKRELHYAKEKPVEISIRLEVQ